MDLLKMLIFSQLSQSLVKQIAVGKYTGYLVVAIGALLLSLVVGGAIFLPADSILQVLIGVFGGFSLLGIGMIYPMMASEIRLPRGYTVFLKESDLERWDHKLLYENQVIGDYGYSYLQFSRWGALAKARQTSLDHQKQLKYKSRLQSSKMAEEILGHGEKELKNKQLEELRLKQLEARDQRIFQLEKELGVSHQDPQELLAKIEV